MNRLSALVLACACAALSFSVAACGSDDDGDPLDDDSGSSTITVNGSGLTQTSAGFNGGTGHVVSAPAGIDCAVAASGAATGSCSATFARDAVVVLQATADSGSSFSGWLDDASGSDFDYEQTQDGFATSGLVMTPSLTLAVDEGRQLAVSAAFVLPPQ